MTDIKKVNLKEKIIGEMMVDYSNSLDKSFNLAKQFIRITRDGKVDVLQKEKLSGTERISLYLIGKLYAKEAGFALTDDASNTELMNELGILKGSLLPWIKELRDKKKIKSIKREKLSQHHISINIVEKTLKEIEAKLNKR
jgi:hypothetical protein